MHACQHRFVFRPLAFGERHVLQPVALLPERRDAEVAPCGRQVDGLALLDDGFFAQPVFDERCDRNDLEAELPGDLRQLRQARHRAVLVHDLDQCACGLQAGQPGEVYRGLGMPRTAQHAFLAGTQRVDVPRAAEVGGPGRGVGQGAYGGGAVMDRDARGAAVAEQVDRHGEGRAQQRGVVLFHHVEPQFGAPLLRQRGAEHAASLLEHEVHDFGRDFLRRDDEVAFVLAVFVVDDDHYPAVAEIFNNLFYTIQNRAFCHFV